MPVFSSRVIVFLYFNFNKTMIASNAVKQSIKREYPKSILSSRSPAMAGDKILIADDAVAYIPYTLVNFSSGQIKGKNAFSNGVCIPAPIDLNIQAPYNKYNDSKPFINKTDNINVVIPVIVSPIIIRCFLLNLSPHVPENIEIIIWGR